jgi:L-ribulose-5-phosphate 3-epimerase UlaE
MTKVYYQDNGENEYQIFYEKDQEIVNGYINKKNSEPFFEAETNIGDIQQFTTLDSLFVEIGVLHLRVWRSGIGEKDMREFCEDYDKVFRNSMISMEVLVNELKAVFSTIHPCQSNLSSFGMKIRNLLLLSCMEVESSFTGILKANNYEKDRYNTNDYVKLLKPLMLNEYTIKWIDYPEIEEQQPFINWSPDSPTQSIDWYDNYNKTKHNREEELSRANLEMAIKSISALAVMLYAQFGSQSLINGVVVKEKPTQFYIRDIDQLDTTRRRHDPGQGFESVNLTV